jgi:RNA polymerase sigma factor (sigma-70 family)
LYRIAVNTFKNRVRTPWWKRLTPLTWEQIENLTGPNMDLVQAARRRVEYAFQAVSSEERALVTLFELEEWQVAELAALFGTNEATIKMRLSRARRKMREALVRREVKKNVVHRPIGAAGSEERVCVAVKPSED